MDTDKKMMPLGQLFRRSFMVYEHKFWPMVQMAALPYLGIAAMFLLIALGDLLYVLLGNLGIIGTVTAILLMVLLMIAVVIAFLFSYVAQVAMMYFVWDKEKNISIIQALRRAKSVAWGLFLLSLMVGIFVLLWSLLLIIPGIIMSVYYSLATWVLIVEKRSGLSAIRRSQELVRGNWWAVFGRNFSLGFLVWLLVAIPGIFVESNSANEGVYGMLTNALLLLFTPFMVAYSYNIYKDLVKIKSSQTTV